MTTSEAPSDPHGLHRRDPRISDLEVVVAHRAAVVPLHHEARVGEGLEAGAEAVALAEVRPLTDPEGLGRHGAM